MIILNAGVPRSGTVLVNAILRALFKMNKTSIAQANPHGGQLPTLVRTMLESGQARHKTILVHTHSWDEETAELVSGSPYVTGFINYRDPRDVCVSLMRLHDHDFKTTAPQVEAYFSAFASTVKDVDLLVLPYEYLTADVEGHVFQIARRLGFWPGHQDVVNVTETVSLDAHRAVMTKLQQGQVESVRARANAKRTLIEDPKTLINDRHIQSGKVGRWREELSAQQQEVANKRFAALLSRYGYPP